MSTVVIKVAPPGGSFTDFTDDVVYSETTFESQFMAVPGTFSCLVRDPERTHSFASGYEIQVEIDGILMFGGYVTQVSMTHLVPAADTDNISTYMLRAWRLVGTDYNIILDKRILRNTADYLTAITFTGDHTDGAVLRDAVANFADLSDFTTTGIADVYSLSADDYPDVREQALKLRELFQNWSLFGGATYWVGADKDIVYIAYETATKSWGFSDQPNGTTLIGFRDVTATEDGGQIANDALIWGGGQFSDTGGSTVFHRTENATSEGTYGRWQTAETHFGEKNYQRTSQVTARANVIVNGPPGADAYGEQKGLRFPQWNFTFTWFALDVPSRGHLLAGQIADIQMNVFGVDRPLPLRSLRISFPGTLEPDGTFMVQFEGTFGLQLSDPFTLWRYLQTQKNKIHIQTAAPVTSGSPSAIFGGDFQGAPTPPTDGSTTVFRLPFGYIAGTLHVYLNGLQQTAGVSFTETDPTAGTFTMATAPLYTDSLLVTMNTLSGSNPGTGSGGPGTPADFQALINAAPNSSTLDLTGLTASGIITVNKTLQIVNGTLNGPSNSRSYVVNITAPGVEIDGMTVNGGFAGIVPNGCANPIVHNCTINNVVYAGIFSLGSQGGHFYSNHINGVRPVDATDTWNAYGITMTFQGGTVPTRNALVEGNFVENIPTWHGLDTHGGIDCTFRNNTIQSCRRAIFMTTYPTNATVDGNDCTAPTTAEQSQTPPGGAPPTYLTDIRGISTTGGSGTITNNTGHNYPSGRWYTANVSDSGWTKSGNSPVIP